MPKVILVLVAAGLLAATPAAAKPGDTWSRVIQGETNQWTTLVEGHVVRDRIEINADFSLLIQGSIVFERTLNPGTMRGAVKGSFGGGASSWWTSGELWGRITPEGMTGRFTATRTVTEYPLTSGGTETCSYTVAGTWTGGHPKPYMGLGTAPYTLVLDGHVTDNTCSEEAFDSFPLG
jgi:hypothetical protein